MHPNAKFRALAMAVSLMAVSVSVVASEMTGELSQVTTKTITIGGTELAFEPDRAECYDATNQRMTCQTLVAVGYAQEARVVIENGRIVRVHVVTLHQ